MSNDGNFLVTTTTDHVIVLTREFDAPRHVVFEAWTKAEHVRQWWDPTGVPLSACEIDFRPKGSFRWVNSAHGEEHVFAGMYQEISAPERLVFSVDLFPSRPSPVTTLEFNDAGEKTKLTMTIRCESEEDRDAMLQMRIDVGTGLTLQKLAEYLDREGLTIRASL